MKYRCFGMGTKKIIFKANMKKTNTTILFSLFVLSIFIVPFCAWRTTKKDLDVFYCTSDAGEVCVCDSQKQELKVDCPASGLQIFSKLAK